MREVDREKEREREREKESWRRNKKIILRY